MIRGPLSVRAGLHEADQQCLSMHVCHCTVQPLNHSTSPCSILGCSEGRSSSTWVDFNLYGHQIVAHHVAGYNASSSANAVDGDAVPVPHFGVVLTIPGFHALADRLKEHEVTFVIAPHLRFVGMPGEQWTMFFHDPSGNSLEFKAMTTPENLFAKYTVL